MTVEDEHTSLDQRLRHRKESLSCLYSDKTEKIHSQVRERFIDWLKPFDSLSHLHVERTLWSSLVCPVRLATHPSYHPCSQHSHWASKDPSTRYIQVRSGIERLRLRHKSCAKELFLEEWIFLPGSWSKSVWGSPGLRQSGPAILAWRAQFGDKSEARDCRAPWRASGVTAATASGSLHSHLQIVARLQATITPLHRACSSSSC